MFSHGTDHTWELLEVAESAICICRGFVNQEDDMEIFPCQFSILSEVFSMLIAKVADNISQVEVARVNQSVHLHWTWKCMTS